MDAFTIHVSFAQIAVFHGGLENPFNDWTDQHVAQGFSWRPGSVSFKALLESGPTAVEARVVDATPTTSGIRAIAVPFDGPEGGAIEIASIADGRTYDLPLGEYQLLFETGESEGGVWCRFTFVRNGSRAPQILAWDSEVLPSMPLRMHAEPA